MLLARGTADAAGAFRARQAEWQRGIEPDTRRRHRGRCSGRARPLLGIGARSDVLRAYQNYRAGLADVIEGTTYPQTRARFEAIKTLERLRTSLRSGPDRASVDVVLGVILTDAASSAGPQRETQQRNALAAFMRAVREDPANATAKLDLEVLLQATAPRTKSQARPYGLDQSTSDRATRTPATRPRPRARTGKDSESMPPLAQLVFLTPRAALVGLAFAAPLVTLAIRERAYSRVRSTLDLRRPRLARVLTRPVGLVALAALVAATAAQPAVRATDPTPVRSDAELFLTFDVSRSMLADERAGRGRAVGARTGSRQRMSTRRLRDLPTGVATLTNRMMPLLFPTGDARGVTAVIDHSLRIMQPRPERLTRGPRELAGRAEPRRRPQLLQPERPQARARRVQRPRHRLLQPRRDAPAAAEAPDRAVRRPGRGPGRADLRLRRPPVRATSR